MNLTAYRHLSIPWLVMRDGLRFMLEGSGEFSRWPGTQGRHSTAEISLLQQCPDRPARKTEDGARDSPQGPFPYSA